MRGFRIYRFSGHRRSFFRAFGYAVLATLMLAVVCSVARAQPALLPDKPFAEHRIALQLSDNDPKKQNLVISIANNLLKFYDPDKVAIEVVAFGPGIDLLRADNANRKMVESLVAQGVRFDVCLNTVETIERETGQRPDIIPVATPVPVGVGQILSLTENGYTLVRP
jgi:intracellular sulfur oxidation DsrE/DsrF family protein